MNTTFYLKMYTAGLEIDIRIILELVRPMTQAVGRRPLAAEAVVRSQVSIVKSVLDRVALGQDFHRILLVFHQ